MEGQGISNNLTIYLMLLICIILITVDSYEIYKIIKVWTNSQILNPLLFQKCIKSDLLIKSIFAVFSLLASISAFILTLFITINLELFIDKLMKSYLKLVYEIFGPCMLAFSIYGIIKWNDVVYVCDPRDAGNTSIFSVSNMFSLTGSFIVSLLLTLGVTIYDSIMLYINSISREDGSKFIRTCFWLTVLKLREANNIPGHRENNYNMNSSSDNREAQNQI